MLGAPFRETPSSPPPHPPAPAAPGGRHLCLNWACQGADSPCCSAALSSKQGGGERKSCGTKDAHSPRPHLRASGPEDRTDVNARVNAPGSFKAASSLCPGHCPRLVCFFWTFSTLRSVLLSVAFLLRVSVFACGSRSFRARRWAL